MNALKRRLDKLETTTTPRCSPAIKRWLGIPLTAAEAAQAEAEPVEPMDSEEAARFDEWWHDPSRGPWQSSRLSAGAAR
ncbi:hypothetical protein Q9K01_10895 [Qipengyuania sp. DY56-A-20]|jgi:hypothetical protein|uniref:Uncharacterized protein n=1 Tax=Qipengyuania benthica TaxID=3067651 RepID=A0ABT9H9Y3_9SPHN|nr:hypothetical protein [Qipengyuania sp. DY56-A-20]MDP4540134.1 hypothetical protein [Qipengyuania sp. DY56-A-20]